MNKSYSEILAKFDTPPLWFDEHAVPRWIEFSPQNVGVFSNEMALVLIRCQNCRHEFKVLMREEGYNYHTLYLRIAGDDLHYGDPPNVGCCRAGPTMSSETIRVLEYWHRPTRNEWVRDHQYEIEFPRLDDEVYNEF